MALDVLEFREKMFAAIMKIKHGFWAASVNEHYTYCTLFTVWNINKQQVTVFHFNFSSNKIYNAKQLLAKTNPFLEELNIDICITLQDGFQKDITTALPLFHFSINWFTVFKNINIFDAQSGETLHYCSILKEASKIDTVFTKGHEE